MLDQYDWQELVTSEMVSYFRRFPTTAKCQNTSGLESVVALVNHVGVWIYPTPESVKFWIPKQELELIGIKGASVTIEALTPFVTATSATRIFIMYGKCRSAREEMHASWKFYRLATSELVMAKNLCFIDSLHHRASSAAVLVRRHGINIHTNPLLNGNSPCGSGCIMFIPAKNLSAETLRRYFSVIEAAEILAVFRMSRDQLLFCLQGGKR